MEATECGAAALGIILGYHGRHVPLEELRVECRVSRDGSNALYVKKTAEKYGLIGRGYQMTVEELQELRPPFMVFWELNHFLVIEGFGRDRVYLSDPATGRRSVDLASFRASYTGIVFKFEPGPNFEKGGERPGIWRPLWRRMAGARAAVLFVVLAGLAVATCDLVAASFHLVFVDQLLVEQRAHWIRPLLLAMSVTLALRLVAGTLQLLSLRKLKSSLAMVHSARFLWHVLRLPLSFYQQRYAGDVSSRVDGNSLVAELISGQLATTLVSLLMLGFHAAIVWSFDPALMLVGVAIGSLNLFAITIAARRLEDESIEVKHVRSRLQGTMMRALQIIETIKAGAAEPDMLARLTGLQARLSNATQAIGAANAMLVAIPPFLLLVTTAIVLWLGGLRVIDGVLSIGALLALQTLMVNFNRPFGDLVRLGSAVQSLEAELARLDDVYHYDFDPIYATPRPHAPDSQADPAARVVAVDPPRRLSGHLVLRDVAFGYNRTIDEPLIRRFSLEIQPGSRVALVGASGSGKSTIGRLVAGLEHPWEGEILYDGYRIDQIPREVFTNQVALVDDQVFLFNGTVRENLTLWDDTVPEREIVRATIDAAIHRDLIARKGGYLAQVAEGARNLSGGQRQRLEIARALLRSPSILVLDEATSALDPLTERLVDDHVRQRGCTCLIIAHRLSTIRDADRIIVLRQGRVVEQGTHDELMANSSGYYHELQRIGEELDASITPPGGRPDDARGRGSTTRGRDRSPAAETEDETASEEERGSEPGEGAALPRSEVESRLDPDATRRREQPSARAMGFDGDRVTTAGNRPLPLDDAGAVWRVESGVVDVFYLLPAAPGQTRGSRRHFCRVGEGDCIFALGEIRGSESGGLLAVGAGEATLCKFPRADLLRLGLEPDWRDAVAEMVDEWVDRVSRALEPTDPPRPTVWLEDEHHAEIPAHHAIATRNRVAWVRTDGPSPRFLGSIRLPECAFGSRFPLSPHAWLSVDGPIAIRACDTPTLMEAGDPWVGLDRFHRVILDALAATRRRERAVRHARLEHTGLRDDAMVTNALSELSRLARPDAPIAPVADSADRLLAACRLVGSRLGIDVKAPPMDESDEPLRVIARASGFHMRRVRLESGWWNEASGPMLGFRQEDQRPVALLPDSRSGYVVVDPSDQTRQVVNEDVARTLSRAAILPHGTLRGDRISIGDLARFARIGLRGERRTVLLMGLLAGMLGLVAPTLVALAIDDVVPRAARGQLGLISGFLVTLAASIACFQLVQGLALARLKGKLESRVLPAVWDRLLSLPARFFAGHDSGDLALRAMGLARVIEVFASTAVASMLVGAFSLLNVFILFALDWRLAMVACALIAMPPLALLAALPMLWNCQRRLAWAQGRISALLLMLLGGIARLRVAGAERRAFARWAQRYHHQLALMLRYQRISDAIIVFNDVWPIVATMVVFASMIRLGAEQPTIGQFLAFNLALAQALTAVIGMGKGILPLLNGLEQWERARPILESAPEASELLGEIVRLGGAIRLSNVSFRYDHDGPLILDDVNIQARPGEFIAIVGPSGSGKSTLLRLLLGFETPTEGVVAYDGRELSTLDPREVRRQVGVVLQNAQLFPGDIHANIVGLSSTLSFDDAWQAAVLAGLNEDIESMPMGIHTVVGEGGGALSSGQRQRLIIARALAPRPRILLLDEATSALDNRTQALVSQNIKTRLQGTTRVAIAHRLSTVAEADRIYVLQEGRIAQSGRFPQLLAEPGPFRDLARRQSLA